MFILSKLLMEPNSNSSVPVGTSRKASNFNILRNHLVIKENSFNDIKINDQIFVIDFKGNYIRTSPISEILHRDDHRVLFKTQTSYYGLDKED